MVMNTSRVRHRLEMQGFCNLDDSAVTELNVWLRFTPALCAVLVAAATLLASVPLFIAVAATAFLGALFARHPFDYIYNNGLRHITGTRMLPPNGAPRRFACGVATVWLSATAWSFAAGAITAGRILGTLFVATAMIPVLTQFCVPSFLFQWIAARRSEAVQS
jgi:hypothetical protein